MPPGESVSRLTVRYTSARMRLATDIPVFTLVLSLFLAFAEAAEAQAITAAGQPAQLDIRAAGESSLRVTLKPLSLTSDFPSTPRWPNGPIQRPP